MSGRTLRTRLPGEGKSCGRRERDDGMVRRIEQDRCISCMQCIAACPWLPKRLQWYPVHRKAQKCDLCVDTLYLKEKGGAGGTQACAQVCPVSAIDVIAKMPDQKSHTSYEANLRGKGWVRPDRWISEWFRKSHPVLGR